MKFVRQPEGSNLCGHACLAMVLGLDLDAACKQMGHKRKTYTRELVAALGDHADGTRLHPLKKGTAIPLFCVLKVTWKRDHGHFVVYKAPDVYDPEALTPVSFGLWRDWVARHGGRVTSFLRLRRP